MSVCGFCRTTLVRRDEDLENVGIMADLAEDHSPFRLHFRGHYRKTAFELIGRLQLRYDAGYWNEWYARFDDGRMGWISEGSGLCYVTFEHPLKAPLPPLDALKLGQTARLDGQLFTVTDLEHAQCVAAQGELPFRAQAGYDAPSVDMRSDTGFASIDYSDTPPRLYVGEATTLDTLLDAGSLASGDVSAPAKLGARTFKCTNCGAPMTVRSGEILAVGCAHCGAVIDAQDPKLAVLSHAVRELSQPFLTLGSTGKLRGQTFVLIGYLNREMHWGNETYYWDEYLMYSEQAGYAWLSEYDGHWNIAYPCTRLPSVTEGERPTAQYGNKRYKHFQRYKATVVQVLGEFTWRVRNGDTVIIDDFIAPPDMLSCERDDHEITWTHAVYLPREEVAHAFKKEGALPQQNGVAANQPGYSMSGVWLTFFGFAILALVLQMGFSLSARERQLWQGDLILSSDTPKPSLVTPVLHVEGGGHNLIVREHADVENQWIDADLQLTNTQTGQTIEVERELSYYEGSDGDGPWQEGSRDDRAVIGDIPDGDYVMQIDGDTQLQPGSGALQDHIVIARGGVLWGNFWGLIVFLLLFPAWSTYRYLSLERRRWAESDYGGE